MGAFKLFDLLEEEEEDDHSHPDKEEDSENGFSACIHYKKVKEGVQHDSNEQPNGTGSKLGYFRFVITESQEDADGA